MKELQEHDYGFIYGSTKKGMANVARLYSDGKFGTGIIIETASQSLHIRITPGGKIIPFAVHKKKKSERTQRRFRHIHGEVNE